jgi:predicted RNA binding protein YcfA (HicA-like mRNA interferase family)
MNAREVIKILKADGWIEKNKKGSHRHFIHPTKKGKVQVPDHGHKDLKETTLKSIFKQAGLK